jgi:hypothetical protein
VRLRPALLVASAFACIVVGAAAPEPSDLTRRLADPSARRRDEAARELLALGTDAAPALRDAASSSDPEVRARARALLALLRDDGAIRARAAEDAVRDALRTPGGLDVGAETDARISALEPDSSRALASAARRVADRGYVARPLACALARHATSESLAALAEFVRDGRVFASTGLCAARELDRVLAQGQSRAARVRASAATALSALEQAMRAPDATTRRLAVALVGGLAGDAGVARIVETASDVDVSVRVESARVLGLYAPTESAATLRALAADEDAGVRVAALTALLAVPGAPHPEPAVAAARDATPAVRAAAARLLARDATPETVVVVETLAVDPSARVRAEACRALAALRR